MPSSPEPLSFTFWGVGVTVEVPTDLDGDHLRYYFDDHLGPASAPVSGEVRVVPADDFRSVARGRSLLLCYRPQCHLERALDALEAWCPDS